MNLGILLNDAASVMKAVPKGKIDPYATVTGITDDTRLVEPGMIFVCVKGTKFDGHSAAEEVMAMGAVCVIAEHDTGIKGSQIIVEDSKRFYGLLCAAWNFHPEKKLKLIGVTGTNGKTTMATMIYEILSRNGRKCGFIGTTGALICGAPVERDDSTPTTPRVSELYKIFGKMVNAGCEYCVMEVTSFALEQNRIGPAVFEAGVFTNLTQDHLDYHKTMENYYLAKKKLFTDHCKTAYINTSDEYGKRLYCEISCEKYSYAAGRSASVFASDIRHTPTGTKFWFNTTGTRAANYPITLNMVGSFNVLNATAAIAVCLRAGLTIEKIASALSDFGGVRGRCEVIPTDRDFTVVCDYAHSPDALENMLPSVRENTRGRLICLFGCGGDRDRTKRPLMAKAVEKYADHIIVTSDNPRNEDPDAIIDEIITGFSPEASYDRVTDRREAIFHAVKIAKKGDVIVLAGKGHEDYQILADGVHIHFDEREVVADALKALREEEERNVRETMTLGEICEAVGGHDHGTDYKPDTLVYADEISSDSRDIKRGGLFIGIKGDNFDGNSFAGLAVNKCGAVCAVTDRYIENTPCIVVKDTRRALLDMAGHFRRKFNTIVVGVTGSVGKTTSKEMLALTVGSKYETMKTEGNHNNEIGLPFTLFLMTRRTEAAVIEMGMSDFGEMARLSKAANPDICVITNIGYSHVEKLGSRSGILKAKLEILSGAKPKAPLIVNADDDMLAYLKERYDREREVITCGIKNTDADYRAADISDTENGVEFNILYRGDVIAHCVLPVIGDHHIIDALLAVAAAVKAGCDVSAAVRALENYKPTGLRQHIEEHCGQKVIVDCYNAAPASMEAAIDVLCKVEPENGGRRVCVFGDMLELGNMSAELHGGVGTYAAKKNIDLLVCYGKFAAYAAESAAKHGLRTASFTEADRLTEFLKGELHEGDVVLFKGSRGMKLEEIISRVYANGENG